MYNQGIRRCLFMANNIQFKVLFKSATVFPTVGVVPSICRTANYTTSQLFNNVDTEMTEIKELLKKQTITEKDLDEILTNPEYHKLYILRKREVELLRHMDSFPEVLRPEDWLHLILTPSTSNRRKYLRHRFLVECKKHALKQKKVMKMENPKYDSPKGETNFAQYSLYNNTLFLRFTPITINKFYTKRLMRHIPFAPKIVFDCGYEKHMNYQESINCVKQLTLSYAINRTHQNPLDIYLCNLEKYGMLMKSLRKMIPIIEKPHFSMTVTSETYVNLFDKENLVYLSPHASTYLNKFDENKIYIIGAIVDKFTPNTLSLEKAAEHGIPTCRLPLERHLSWGPSSGKNLTINQVLSILLDLRQTNDWGKALQHVPNRKLQPMRLRNLVKKIAFD